MSGEKSTLVNKLLMIGNYKGCYVNREAGWNNKVTLDTTGTLSSEELSIPDGIEVLYVEDFISHITGGKDLEEISMLENKNMSIDIETNKRIIIPIDICTSKISIKCRGLAFTQDLVTTDSILCSSSLLHSFGREYKDVEIDIDIDGHKFNFGNSNNFRDLRIRNVYGTFNGTNIHEYCCVDTVFRILTLKEIGNNDNEILIGCERIDLTHNNIDRYRSYDDRAQYPTDIFEQNKRLNRGFISAMTEADEIINKSIQELSKRVLKCDEVIDELVKAVTKENTNDKLCFNAEGCCTCINYDKCKKDKYRVAFEKRGCRLDNLHDYRDEYLDNF